MKGAVRTWIRIDSAAKWLMKSVGIAQVVLEIAHWSPGQMALEL